MPTKIEWCDEVWNPITGCTPCGPGCDHCYAKRMATRLAGRCGYPADDPFRVTFHKNRLELPMKWKKPKRIFVNSMGDLFHENVKEEWIEKVFATMGLNPRHTYLILTKRPDRMAKWIMQRELGFSRSIKIRDGEMVLWPYGKQGIEPKKNIWLGCTAENQELADMRSEPMLKLAELGWNTFISVEPMLGPVSFRLWHPKPRWVIVGGETGPGARYMVTEHAVNVWRQCKEAGVPFFFKQWGSANKQPPCGGLPREFPK